MFLILVARAAATVWEVQRSAKGVICNLEKKTAYVNHDSFHIMDRQWGHLTIKMSGHPPFGAQVILNGHEYVACQARKHEVGFTKDGNCFTGSPTRTRWPPSQTPCPGRTPQGDWRTCASAGSTWPACALG